MKMKNLVGKVCLVTGATRGIGKGIALQLGGAGATVYITGRTLNPPKDKVGGCLNDTAKEIEERGGKCIPVQCDHSKEDQILKLFTKIKTEQNGKLDVLVNNAYAAVYTIFENIGKPFWEADVDMWDSVNNVGLRNHYYCAVYASRMMTEQKSGLIVNISSAGGLRYLFNVPYGIGKAACDRMAADCAVELQKYNVAFVSLWPGAVKTEIVSGMMEEANMEKLPQSFSKYIPFFKDAESPEFAGKCIACLANDPDIMKRNGRVLLTAELGQEYNLTDIDGVTTKPSFRQLNTIVATYGPKWLAYCIPNFVKIPYWMITLAGSKF